MAEVGSTHPGGAAPPRLRGTLRLRVTALAVAVVTAVLLVTAAVLITAQHQSLQSALDDALVERADELDEEVLAAKGWPPTLEVPPDEDVAWQVVTPDGVVLAASAGLVGRPALVAAGPIAPPTPAAGGTIVTRDAPPLDEEAFPYRLLSRPIAGAGEPAVALVAHDLEDVLASTRTLTQLLAIAIPIVAGVLAVLIWVLVGRTLGPVEAIRAEVSGIGARSLDRRVPQPSGDDEIARLARTMNEMLDRIEDATRRQERFVADAAHELRTPLTRLRTQLEVDLAHPDRSDPAASLGELLAETLSMQRLLDDLLALARGDAGAPGEPRVPIDLDDLVLREARRLRENGRVTVDAGAVSAASVVGEPSGLARVVRNVVDNAERHASSQVTFSLREVGDRAVLLVDDDGPGIPEGRQEAIFERFTRLDDARSRDAGGTGLGLAIAREIVEAHGGTVRVDPDHVPGARFVVELPLAPG